MHPRFKLVAYSFFILLWCSFFSVLAAPLASGEETTDRWSSTPVLQIEEQRTLDLLYPQHASVKDIYRSFAKIAAIDILFDPKLRDHAIELELHGTRILPALDAITRAAGHFFVVLDSNTLLIADDTPQMRREYEHQVLRTFAPEHARIADLMTMLRALLGVKHIASDTNLNRITVRDTAERVELAEVLFEAHDRPADELEFRVEVLRFSIDPRNQADVAFGELSAAELERFKERQGAEHLTSFSVRSQGQRSARFELRETFEAGAPGLPALDIDLELKLSGRTEAEPPITTVTFDVQLAARLHLAKNQPSQRRMSSSFRVMPDSVYLVTGLSRVDSDSKSEVALVIEPRVVSTTPGARLDHTAYWTGSESRVRSSTRR